PAAGGVAHQCRFLEIERLDDGREIIGIAVHVVSGRGLAGPAMAPPVMRNDAEATLREVEHLAIPGIGAERPAVGEGDGRALAPVLVVNLRAVFGGDGAHGVLSFHCASAGLWLNRAGTRSSPLHSAVNRLGEQAGGNVTTPPPVSTARRPVP